MKFCRNTVCAFAAVLLLCLLSACGRAEAPSEPQTIKIWYINGSPDVLGTLSFDDGVSADIRGFDSEEELAEAFNTIRPDIVFCSMQQAEHMFENGHLTAFPAALFKGIEETSDIVSAHCFLHIGGAVELMTVDRTHAESGIADFDSLCAAAKTAGFVSVSDYSRAFAALLMQDGESFMGLRNRDIRNPSFVEVYNRFAELALRGCLTKENAVCRIVSSPELSGFVFESTEIYPLAERGKPVLTEYYGFVCTGSAGSIESFLSALPASRGDIALSCGLVPVTDDAAAHSDPLSVVLLEIKSNRTLIPLTADCEWLENSTEFNKWVSTSLDGIK